MGGLKHFFFFFIRDSLPPKFKVYKLNEEDGDVRRLRIHPSKTITMKTGYFPLFCLFFPLFKNLSSFLPYFFYCSFIKKNISMLSADDNCDVQVQMPMRMNEIDFQNVVYSCCGLVLVWKFGLQHSKCYGSAMDEELIKVSAQNCGLCGAHCGGVVQLARHMEKHYTGLACFICALCRNIYITKTVLDCHILHNHSGSNLARRDYERKYKLRT